VCGVCSVGKKYNPLDFYPLDFPLFPLDGNPVDFFAGFAERALIIYKHLLKHGVLAAARKCENAKIPCSVAQLNRKNVVFCFVSIVQNTVGFHFCSFPPLTHSLIFSSARTHLITHLHSHSRVILSVLSEV
jgi:hypothetical protein